MLCSLFGLPASTYYEQEQRKDRIDVERIHLRATVAALFNASNQSAGGRTLVFQLALMGLMVGRYKVSRLMEEAELVSKQPGRHNYKAAGAAHPMVENHLQREFNVQSPNQVWCGDITYVWVGKHWAYLVVVIDLYARRVIGWATSQSPDSALTIKALSMAYSLRGQPKGVMFHSDQGCQVEFTQYSSGDYQRYRGSHRLVNSMSAVGHCVDDAACEGFFGMLKRE